ncbi:hypothetical protein D9M72_550470 [compost metagenome]
MRSLRSVSISMSLPNSSRMRRSAMAVLAVSPPVSWNRWRPSTCPPMATASATCTASSASRWPMAGRWNCRKPGLPTAIPGSSSGAKAPTKSASAASSKPPMSMRKSNVSSGSRPNASSPRPSIRPPSAGGQSVSTRFASGRRSRSTRSCLPPSTPATTSARCGRATRRKA